VTGASGVLRCVPHDQHVTRKTCLVCESKACGPLSLMMYHNNRCAEYSVPGDGRKSVLESAERRKLTLSIDKIRDSA
ncbi:hypothetical protein GBAR_LOCUS31330, partial [Geodia barretti]